MENYSSKHLLHQISDDDTLKRPQQLSDQRNINIEHLEIDMEPSIGAFEDELCRLINEDRLERRKVALAATNNLPAESNARVSIVERRLRVISSQRKSSIY